MGLEVDSREISREEKHPMENLPIDLNRPKSKGAKIVSADLVSIRLDYEDSN